MFSISAAVIFILVVLGAAVPVRFGNVAGLLYDYTTKNFGWFYLLVVFIIILFLAGLAISKYGAIRLGGDEQRPDYPFFTWIGMLFSAGFGVGLVFLGCGGADEPFFYFADWRYRAAIEQAARSRWAIRFSIGGFTNGRSSACRSGHRLSTVP